MKILIASDHAGFSLKEELKQHEKTLGIEFEDLGTHSAESVDYPDFAQALCRKLIEKNKSNTAHDHLGILICGSGVGISIAANRFPGIRAVLAETDRVARLSREHNHANVLCMGSQIVSVHKALEITKAFLEGKPDLSERHLRRIQKLGQLC